MLKKIFLIIVVFLLIISVSLIFIKPILIAFAKNKIEHAITDSTISVEKITLNYNLWSLLQQKATGEVYISQFKHLKFIADNIKLKLRWEGRHIFLDAITGQVFNGDFEGKGSLTLVESTPYLIELNFTNVDLARVVKDFELKEKVEMDGLLSGQVILDGVGQNFNILNGNFSTSADGGNMTIKDTRFLENMAISSKLPANLVVDSFKDYHYNIGLLKMFLEKGDLVLDMSLDGKSGKRNLKIDLHDFSLK